MPLWPPAKPIDTVSRRDAPLWPPIVPIHPGPTPHRRERKVPRLGRNGARPLSTLRGVNTRGVPKHSCVDDELASSRPLRSLSPPHSLAPMSPRPYGIVGIASVL